MLLVVVLILVFLVSFMTGEKDDEESFRMKILF